MSRRRHFVGTVPCPHPEEGLQTVLRGSDDITSMSDTESTDGRADWIIPILQARTQHANIIALKGLHYYDRDTFHLWNTCVCMRRPRRDLTDSAMALPYARHAEAWFPTFERVTDALGLGDVRYQVDVAAPFTMAAFTWGPGVFAHYDDEVAAAVKQIEQVLRITGGRVVFQISAPVETVLTAWAPTAVREMQAEVMADRIVGLAAASPAGTEFIVHECVGRPRGKPVTVLKDLGPVADLTTAIVRRWPAGRVLNAIHLPIGDVTHPAPVDPDYYAPLRWLNVPARVVLIAGLANLHVQDSQQRAALRIAELATGRELGVSTPCGLGGDEGLLVPMIRRTRDLAGMPTTVGSWDTLIGDRDE
jgi:hypothetical protein